MRLLCFLFFLVAALHSAVDAAASKERRSTSNILTPDFVESVQKIVDAEGIPGLTLAIVNKTGPAELGSWGIKSENGTKMTTDTLFNLGSCSKAFLSASLGIVIDDFAHGRNTTSLPAGLSTLTWKTKVADILLNDWELMDPWASQKANLIDILSHVSGVASHDYSFKIDNSHGASLSNATRNLRNYRPTFELREQFLYENPIVSTLTGMHYPDFVNSRIFKPLGMTSSTYSINAALKTGRFTNTWTSFGRLIPPWIKEEYVPWVRTILNNGTNPDTNVTIIPSAQFNVITSAHSIVGPNVSAVESTVTYGLGWFRETLVGHDAIWHPGGAPGVSTIVAAALEDGIGIVALTNADTKADPILNIVLEAAEKAFGSGNSSSSPSSSSTVTRRSNVLLPRHDAGVTPRADDHDVDLTGIYYNAGYGTGVLCSVHSTSPSCKSVLDAFRSVDPSSLSPNSTSTDLFASWVTLFSTHIRFTYYTNNNSHYYLISAGSIYPQGYGKNLTAFSALVPVATAEFVVENKEVVGFGWNNIIDGGGGVQPSGSVEETSEVWFVKQA
ncbi:beta-lactamase/transpeptidase-like protein [Russula emetica]|nr:beta-lactamase/transpeptidase-like protein [Russula emetica]